MHFRTKIIGLIIHTVCHFFFLFYIHLVVFVISSLKLFY
uniref:Uncharacterized protein n=1 Tax=Anguilla anguilla TaxID=7936 RepID=A0A0E9TES1_ANGAN